MEFGEGGEAPFPGRLPKKTIRLANMSNVLNLILKTIIILAALFGLVLVLQKQLISLEIVAYVGLVGIYPLTYLAYLGFGAQAQQKRLRDDFRLLGLARRRNWRTPSPSFTRRFITPCSSSFTSLCSCSNRC